MIFNYFCAYFFPSRHVKQPCLQNWKMPWSHSSRCSTVMPPKTVRATRSAGESWGTWWIMSCLTSLRWEGNNVRSAASHHSVLLLNTIICCYITHNLKFSCWCPHTVSEGPCCCRQDHEGPGHQRRWSGGLWGVCFSGCWTLHCLWAVLPEAHEADGKEVKDHSGREQKEKPKCILFFVKIVFVH